VRTRACGGNDWSSLAGAAAAMTGARSLEHARRSMPVGLAAVTTGACSPEKRRQLELFCMEQEIQEVDYAGRAGRGGCKGPATPTTHHL
jgi:uncharacterized protein YgbK (DUF1537 family)